MSPIPVWGFYEALSQHMPHLEGSMGNQLCASRNPKFVSGNHKVTPRSWAALVTTRDSVLAPVGGCCGTIVHSVAACYVAHTSPAC